MSDLKQFDRYLDHDGPAALVIRQYLMPVDGPDGVLFPPTYAGGSGFEGGYNIDTDANGKTVALIDSVGSQANRIEPIFMLDSYKTLVPQITIKAGDKVVNILETGHRAGDALVRCSSIGDEVGKAFQELLKGDASALAHLAPTSLVFGVWDSRESMAKVPRLVSSTIRAYGIRRLRRGAVYTPPVDYSVLNVFSEEDKSKAENDNKSPLAIRGFVHVPASASHGGIIADEGIRRDATLGLAALRFLSAGTDENRTLVLRRYILGLSLVAFTAPPASYLRQGCTLVANPDRSSENRFSEVFPDGRQVPCKITHEIAIEYARATAAQFNIAEDREVTFDPDKAKFDVKAKEKDKSKGKKAKGNKQEVDNEDAE